jgi:hypothetical protein
MLRPVQTTDRRRLGDGLLFDLHRPYDILQNWWARSLRLRLCELLPLLLSNLNTIDTHQYNLFTCPVAISERSHKCCDDTCMQEH